MVTVLACPARLEPELALDFCCKLATVQAADYAIDFTAFRHAPPFGMLLVTAAIRTFVARMRSAGHRVGFERFTGNSYAAHLGFFHACGCEHGNRPGQAKGSDTYVPITELKVDPAGPIDFIHTEINKHATRLARVLLPKADQESVARLHYCFFEIMRNVIEHSGTGTIWLCAQHWPTSRTVEVAILDQGIGIRRSLARRYSVESDEVALALALQEGVSRSAPEAPDPCAFGPQVGPDLDPEGAREVRCNSGYGLFIVSEMCRQGGDFAIVSGNKCLAVVGDRKLSLDAAHEGVAVQARISTAGEGIHRLIQRVATKKYGDTPSTRPRMLEADVVAHQQPEAFGAAPNLRCRP